MAHFDDVIMPSSVRFGSQSAPRSSTQQVFLTSGYRKANQRWAQKLHRLRLSYLRDAQAVHDILKIWQAMEGPAHSFLARDWNDWNTSNGQMGPGSESLVSASDQPLQNTADNSFLGDGATKTFQMVKRYLVGASAVHTRTIQKPQSGAVVALNGVPQGSGFSIDTATGIVTFTAAPGAGVAPTWGGAFYIPVHFAEDDGFVETLTNAKVSELPGIELLEARV